MVFIPAAGLAAVPASEREALLALYTSTDGDHWAVNTNWRKAPDVFNDPETECTWLGVVCDAGGTTVDKLSFPGNQLTGGIPPELGNLANLTSIYLVDNQLTGSIPPELGKLANLTILRLYNNQLSGSIPPELGNLSNLRVLGLHVNLLTGSIPPELGNLANLTSLTLRGNQLTGAIPPELGSLANLQEDLLWANQLTGAIPAELGNLANLRTLELGTNQLTGSIPSELGNLVNLRTLALDHNQLTGAIPSELGNLVKLKALYLLRNQLTGAIPPELGNLVDLTTLRLGANHLTGAIPPELGNLVNLSQGESPGLNLGFNHLYTDNNPLREFLNSRHMGGDWESSQTLPRYFAQFADGGGLFSQVVLFNLNDVSAATGQLELLGDSGNGLTVDLNGETVVGTKELSVPATGLLSLRTDGLGDVQTGSVRVTTDRHVEGVVIFGGGIGLAGVGSSPELRAGFVAPMERNLSRGINTGIAVTVLSGTEATLDLTLLNGGGNAIAHATDQVTAQGHAALFVTEVPWDTAVDFSAFSGTLVVTSSEPIAGTVLQTRPGEFVTLPVAPLEGQPAAEDRLYFAQFAEGAGALSSQILLFNLSDADSATAQITIRDNTGALLTVDLDGQPVAGEKQVVIGPRALRVLVTDGLGNLQVGSVAVTSDQPLAGVILFAGPSVGAAGVGNSAKLEEGFVAPMETNGAQGINTGVAVMNLEAEAVTLDADLLGSEGQLMASAQVRLDGRGHVALFVTDFQWDQPIDFSQFEGLLRVRAGGRTAATVIQTRPGQFATMPVAPKPAD